MERVVLVEHAGNRAFIYRTPCGILTYDKNRKRHEWRVRAPYTGPDQVRDVSFGEDYGAACTYARITTGSHIVLHLDGQPLRRAA